MLPSTEFAFAREVKGEADRSIGAEAKEPIFIGIDDELAAVAIGPRLFAVDCTMAPQRRHSEIPRKDFFFCTPYGWTRSRSLALLVRLGPAVG
jgi:hypothetical protein